MSETVINFDFRLAESQYVQLGKIAAASSVLDYVMVLTIARLLGYYIGRGTSVARRVRSFHGKLDLVTDLLASYEVALAEWKDLRPSLSRAYDQRNDVIHGIWHKDDEGGWRVGKPTPNPGKEPEPQPMSDQQLKQIHMDLMNAVLELLRFLNRHEFERTTSRLGELAEALLDKEDE